jgi:nitrite reductase/ring-hydroxylating ferredoxin subunit
MQQNSPLPNRPVKVATWSQLEDRVPSYALVTDVDLVVVRYDEEVSVLYGRCLHRGALLSDGHVDGKNLICGVHGWDFRVDTGISEYDNHEVLPKFRAWIDPDTDAVLVDADEVESWAEDHPQPFDREQYLGLYQDPHGGPEEPHNAYIQGLARDGLGKVGHHGPVSAMGVPAGELPSWSGSEAAARVVAPAEVEIR